MNWSHVKLIFHREVRDQLRDRRTMFTICILPLLLYPLMGMLMLQLAQFQREQNVNIAVVGYENWPAHIPLITEFDQLDGNLRWKKIADESSTAKSLRGLELSCAATQPNESLDRISIPVGESQEAEACLRESGADAILIVRPGFFAESAKSASNVTHEASESTAETTAVKPTGLGALMILSNQRWERSQFANQQLLSKLNDWHSQWLRGQLDKLKVDSGMLDSPRVSQLDVSPPEVKRVLVWSKLLPFVMLVWALTGAFYPAIDLCAGEKERGTLETLLCSPARRREIVWGKLLTVMCFSIGTALLNLGSMHITASIVMSKFSMLGATDMVSTLGPLPLSSMGWLILLVMPISAMFSALALAVASLARSTKEGQYYLMPLLLVGLPLVMLPMIPGMSLTAGTSIVPVTGAVLLSRALMEGEYALSMTHLPSVFCVTVLSCLLAVRWAVRQFENESVMFPDAERYSIGQWIRNVWRKREDTPTANESLLCGVLILVCLFFGRLMMGGMELTWSNIAQSTTVIQIGLMLAPALIMATMLTRSVRLALRLRIPNGIELIASIMLAISLHPLYVAFASAVSGEFKLGRQTTEMLAQFDSVISGTPLWMVLLVLAVLPAICEELAFRGFVFSGLLRNGGVLRAIVATALLFGLSHGVLQQSITATVMGLLLGWLAYRTGGVACGIAFHMVHNSISMWIASMSCRGIDPPTAIAWAFSRDGEALGYSDAWRSLSFAIAFGIVCWLIVSHRRATRHATSPVKTGSPSAVASKAAELGSGV